MQLAVFPEPTAPTIAMFVKKPSFRDDQPARCFRGYLITGVMCLAHHERKFCPFPGVRIKRQFACPNLAACLEGENVDAGKQDRIGDVRRCIEEEGVGVQSEWP
jgi:hypothetical protein